LSKKPTNKTFFKKTAGFLEIPSRSTKIPEIMKRIL